MRSDGKEFSASLENFHNNDVWGHHLTVPDEVVQYFLEQKIKRVQCTLNGQYEFQCALMPKGNGTYFININSEIRKKFRLRIGTPVQVKLVEDKSQYGMPMPEELQEIFNIDDEASHFFHSLTPGKQRSLLYIIGKPKSSDVRLKKAIVVTEYLKSTRGHLDFKALNQAFKEYNRR